MNASSSPSQPLPPPPPPPPASDSQTETASGVSVPSWLEPLQTRFATDSEDTRTVLIPFLQERFDYGMCQGPERIGRPRDRAEPGHMVRRPRRRTTPQPARHVHEAMNVMPSSINPPHPLRNLQDLRREISRSYRTQDTKLPSTNEIHYPTPAERRIPYRRYSVPGPRTQVFRGGSQRMSVARGSWSRPMSTSSTTYRVRSTNVPGRWKHARYADRDSCPPVRRRLEASVRTATRSNSRRCPETSSTSSPVLGRISRRREVVSSTVTSSSSHPDQQLPEAASAAAGSRKSKLQRQQELRASTSSARRRMADDDLELEAPRVEILDGSDDTEVA